MKTSSTSPRLAALLLVAALLSACASFGIQLETFNERLAAGYASVTFVRDTAGALLDADAITADNAANVQAQADNLRAALDITRRMHETEELGAEDRLAVTLTGLSALADYLRGLQ